MHFSFFSPDLGLCHVKLWATGRYGFSLPKKVEITTLGGEKSCYIFSDRAGKIEFHVSNSSLVRIAISQFLMLPAQRHSTAVVDTNIPLFDGGLVRNRGWNLKRNRKVRPGPDHAPIRAAY